MPRVRTESDPPLPPLAAALVAARIRRRKTDKTATQAKIAGEIEVSQATVSGWERGEEKPRLERLPLVSKAYAIPEPRLRTLWMQTAVAEAA